MPIEVFRDWILSIFFIIATILLIWLSICSVILFLKIRKIIDSIDVIVEHVKHLSEYIDQVSQAIKTILAYVQSIKQGANFFKDMLFKRKEKVEE